MGSQYLKPIGLSLMAIVLTFVPLGCKKASPITLACNAIPPSVYAGEQVTVSATAGSTSTGKHRTHVIYSWSGSGVTGNGSAAVIETDSFDPDNYTVEAEAREGKKGKEGSKPGETAECSAKFTVKAFEPPTVVCSANPSTVKPGETSTITCTGASAQNRALTYSYSTTAGTIIGAGPTAAFSSAGAPTGEVGIVCNVVDDKTHSASARTNVIIVAPPPQTPHVQELCSVSFAHDTERPTQVDDDAKACLDQIVLALKQFPDARVVIVADSNAREKQITANQEKAAALHKHAKVEYFDQQRAVNFKDYLVNGEGIGAGRIVVTTGADDDQDVHNYLFPLGATFEGNAPGVNLVDETTVKPEGRKPLPERQHEKTTATQG